ncbi:MAG: hypothetical protein U0516_04230 [Candidatus Saccharibacteria bacterium]
MEKHPLQSKYSELHTSQPVEHEVARLRQHGERIPNEPAPKLEAWLRLVERTHTGKGGSEARQAAQPQIYERIKTLYHRPTQEGGYITGLDDPSIERYLHHQAQIAHEQGHGAIEDIMARANDQVRAEARETIRTDQERSLDAWLDYLTSDDATYPMWFKYYTFRNITRLADYDKQKGEFPKRSKSTTAPFPDINREALAYMEDSLAKHYGLKDIDPDNPKDAINPETQALLDRDANFASLYKRAIEYAAPKHAEQLNVTDGRWIKYDQTSDESKSKELAHSLHGYGTGWCTAGEGMAHSQLSGGDFYVYYTKSEDGQYSVPRVAIRMQEEYGQQHIAEVRGIEADQNMEAELVPIADAKLAEIDPEGAQQYKKRSEDMRRLTEIDNLLKANPSAELSKDQLRFLYELDSKIEGFGYMKDPRIAELLQTRNPRVDLAFTLDVQPEQISLTKEEALRGNILYHYGYLDLSGLTSTEGLQLPETIGGNLNLSGLTSAEGLQLPETIGGYLDLSGLTSAEGLQLPETIGGGINLRSLTSAEGLQLPETIGGYLDLSGLTSAEGLQLPETIGGYLYLSGLTSAEGLQLPETIGGGINLRSLTSAEGLQLPKTVGGYLILEGLTSADGLHLPETIGGYLDLDSLTSADGLQLPETIGDDLYLSSLTTAEGLQLPETIGGDLYLSSLTTAEGLQLPETIGGQIHIYNLSHSERLLLQKEYPQFADKWQWYPVYEEEEEEEEPEEIEE